MSSGLPKTSKALILSTAKNPETSLFNVSIQERPLSLLKPSELLVRIVAAGFNHRELWQRKNLYPGIVDGSVMGADGAGVVVASGSGKEDDPVINQRVFLVPTRGWKSDLKGPEERFTIIGGGSSPIGTFSEYVIVERDYVLQIPPHLSFEECASWPAGGLTAWRAAFVKGQVAAGQNVLITGIGGGVALIVLQLCVAAGANVYVTSGDQAKIDKAISLGAKGGVSYKSAKWPQELGELLKHNATTGVSSALLDLIVDSAGGDITGATARIIRNGGIIVCFGMHAAPQITITMREILKNIEVKGSTMGSQAELKEATEFLAKHKIVPIVSKVIDGLENAEEGFAALEAGNHVGKIVIKLRGADSIVQSANLRTSSPKL